MFDSALYRRYLDRIESAGSPDALTGRFEAFATEIGFTYYSLISVPVNPDGRGRPFACGNFPDWYLEEYNAIGGHRMDLYIEICAQHVRPVSHREMLPLFDTPARRPLYELGRRLVTNGWLLPFPNVGVARGVALWTDGADEDFDRIIGAHEATIQMLAARFVARAECLGLDSMAIGTVTLSAREAECLRLSGMGYAGSDIAAELGITERTVRFHVANACDKLGAGHRTEAVVRALRRGLIAF
ncbi:MAG: LuxR C-terminal-related transcriptional regulator [Alphaproteobacteria bacterium]